MTAFVAVLPLGLGRLCALWVFVYNPQTPLKGGKLGSSLAPSSVSPPHRRG